MKRISREHAPRTPRGFYDSIKASGTMELHRIPLVLAISSGMYLKVTGYEIPRSVADFYQVMIRHLLRRRDVPFADMPVNRFDANIKERFLREFAYEMAIRPGEFGAFTLAEAIAHARRIATTLGEFPEDQAAALVREIRDNAGLIQAPPERHARVAHDERYLFAHRSIQEYLVAVQLQRHGDKGVEFLLDRATDQSWRQVILFYAALDHEHRVALVRGLADRNPELAGQCLAVTTVPVEMAEPILDRLQHEVQAGNAVELNLRALTAATRSTQQPVREAAVARVRDALADDETVAQLRRLLALDVDQVLRVLTALAESNSIRIVALVPRLLDLIPPEDLRLVAPLWRCLATPRIEEHPNTVTATIRTLLVIAMTEDGLVELQSQPPQRPATLADPSVVRTAYPFLDGLDPESNLVTLLAWAHVQGVTPAGANRFLAARDAGQLGTVERDRRSWRTIAVAPHRPVRRFIVAAFATAVVACVALAVVNWRQLIWPRGWWSLALLPGPPVLGVLVAGILAETGKFRLSVETNACNPLPLFLDDELVSYEGLDDDGTFSWETGTVQFVVITALFTAPYALALTPLINWSIIGYLVVATAAIWVLFWLPACRIFEEDSRLYLRRPNPYVDMYEDPRSRHWVTPPKG